ncbi:hypothetical protein OUZ56_000050 [Daphnia magna]|uniref:Uncharacterized protein n=1 Tax=Daphnia magna TaxID=35525 RepID=A0ABQ9ZYJ9_9CRUS|nr:hypothetical protein OUZ56_000050 [Daphnia magna]
MKTVVALTILLVAVVAVIVSEEDSEQFAVKLMANSSDLATEEQRFRYYKVYSYKLMAPKKKAAKKPSGYSGYQSGYGAFRGRRSVNNKKSVFSSD